MIQDIYDPLSEYANVFHGRFKKVARDTFAQLAQEAQIDIETNRATCRQLEDVQEELEEEETRLSRQKLLKKVLILVVIIGILAAIWYMVVKDVNTDFLTLVGIGAGLYVPVYLLFKHINEQLDELEEKRNCSLKEAKRIETEAWKQMEPLNCLYDWDILTRMMTKTVPRLEFDPYFTNQRLEDLKQVYHWKESFNEDRSVIYSQSGQINGNPFIICRTRKMVIGKKAYTGYKTIHWTTEEKGSDGKDHIVHHTETLEATVVAPYPYYFEKTRLIYGNTAAPDLTFYRQKSQLAGKENTLAFKLKRRQLRNKARDLKGNDFAMMTNEDFETAFDTSNRNSNQQHALLFTPLAQESMTKLLKDYSTGYGDDFDFRKMRMINIIISDHLQDIDLDLNPQTYMHYNYNEAEKEFCKINAEYFRAIYFALAPLLCIPMYQQIRSPKDIYGRDMEKHSSYWEHEALANFWGQDRFKHPECVTDCILKTEQACCRDNDSTITVYAYGHRREDRLTYVEKLGGDGNYHDVPVYWNEYFPVTGKGTIQITEDNNSTTNQASSPTERMNSIRHLLDKKQMSLYRRHIASRLA